tara:strand:+ start:148 stop:966 length:819 start_codon:yes stop_codon:yes gene_type:complete
MRHRHNKKRNTAFLFEATVRELTKSIVAKDHEKRKKILSILREHFGKGTVLSQEYDLYKTLEAGQDLESRVAQKLINEVKKVHSSLDAKKIFREQSSFIKAINYEISKNVFNNFVPNYKDLATIYQMFDSDVSIKKKVILEEKIMSSLTLTAVDQAQSNKTPTDSLVYNTFVKSFNEKYSENLLEEQKQLINKYLTSYADNKLELKIYLNEEISRIKDKIKIFMESHEVKQDQQMLSRFNNVMRVIGSLREKELDSNLIETTAKIQKLVSEI